MSEKRRPIRVDGKAMFCCGRHRNAATMKQKRGKLERMAEKADAKLEVEAVDQELSEDSP